MKLETLELTIEDGLAHIVLNRPNEANSLNLALAKDYLAAAIECDTNPEVRAVLLSATGKIFCAGGDLNYMASQGDKVAPALKEVTALLHAAIATLARTDAPLVIAVNGVAAGAGMSISATGDIVVAGESSRFTMAYTAAGLAPDGSSSYYLPRVIGLRKTQELMLTNRMISADEALEMGLVTKVVPDDDLLDEARTLAQSIAKGPTKAYGQVKHLLINSLTNPLETQMELESRAITATGATEDGREGINAFVNKRKPEFKGY
jgi:2-(1,2-epoxy-1,2-dihydrophenyl)acetyl-CoA isomerase